VLLLRSLMSEVRRYLVCRHGDAGSKECRETEFFAQAQPCWTLPWRKSQHARREFCRLVWQGQDLKTLEASKANLLRCLFRHARILRSHPIMNQVLRWPLLCNASVLVTLQCSKSVPATAYSTRRHGRALLQQACRCPVLILQGPGDQIQTCAQCAIIDVHCVRMAPTGCQIIISISRMRLSHF